MTVLTVEKVVFIFCTGSGQVLTTPIFVSCAIELENPFGTTLATYRAESIKFAKGESKMAENRNLSDIKTKGGNTMSPIEKIPQYLKHKPMLSANYEAIDNSAGYGDAKFLDIGKSTWDKEDISVKCWRRSELGWSQQSEELPLSRVLDLAILTTAAITGQTSSLNEQYHCDEDRQKIKDFIDDNMQIYGPKLEELRQILQLKASNSSQNDECQLRGGKNE